MSDLRFALRQLLKSPGFTATAVLTLALGIGLTAIFFSFADALLFKTLPVPEPERLVQLEKFRKDGSSGESFPFPAYRRLRNEAKAAFSGLAAFSNIRPGTMVENGNPSKVSVMLASGDFHQTLGLIPRVGRLLKPEDDAQNGDEPVAVISHSLWISRFQGDSSVVGKPIQVNGTAYTVIGVTPANFGGVRVGEDPSVTVPIKMLSAIEGQPREVDTWGNWWLRIIARRQPTISLATAELAIAGPWRNILQEQVSSVPPSWQAEA